MGLRYRKSINLGGGFRINLSKSGIGYSWGVKGYRVTKTAKGTTRRTVSMPGTGISYVDEVGKKGKKNKSVSNNNTQLSESLNQGRSTEIVNIDEYQPAEYKELLDKVNKIQNINLLSTILICTFVLSAIPFFRITGIVGIVLKIYTHVKMPVSIEYEFDEDAKQLYENLCAIWMSMNENKKFWQTISEQAINKKVSGGASRGVKRILAKAANKMPYFIKANIKPFGLQLRKQQIFFMPEKLLVISGRKIGAINYSDIKMHFGVTNFVETEAVPKDAKVIGHTWLKVNKDGSPDKRFKENRQVPVCEYGNIIIESGNMLHVELMCSNSATIRNMEVYAKKFFK